MFEVFSASHIEPDKLCSLTAHACFQKNHEKLWSKKNRKKEKLKNTSTHTYKFAWGHISCTFSRNLLLVCAQHKFFIPSKTVDVFSFEKVLLMLPANEQRWALASLVPCAYIHVGGHELHHYICMCVYKITKYNPNRFLHIHFTKYLGQTWSMIALWKVCSIRIYTDS